MPAFPRWNPPVSGHPNNPTILRDSSSSSEALRPANPGVRVHPRINASTTTTTTASTSATSTRDPDLAASGDATTKEFFEHSSGKRINTDAVISKALREQYPNLELVVVPEAASYDLQCNLLAFADAGHADYEPLEDDEGDGNGNGNGKLPSSLEWLVYLPPARRIGGNLGGLANFTVFGKYLYKWQGHEFIVYLIDGRDGGEAYPSIKNYYVLAPEAFYVQRLVLAAGSWSGDLHDEVWVFDGGFWQKSRQLFESVRGASWDSVILDEGMKRALIDDHLSFFDSKDTYDRLQVPWKRGLIYYGPPGNGKTISIKATMHMLFERQIPTLYVRTLASFGGPERSVKDIFSKARQFAPCYLVFEDLDTIVTDDVRSYFLNEMDGLKANDGIFIVGSTNHLDRLDPGISKRPSRFDRKYLFPDPDLDQRIAYCHFWQKKLKGNKDIEFPDELCTAIANITDKFSFAYMQEAFVAALLAIARDSKDDAENTVPEQLDDDDDDDEWLDVAVPAPAPARAFGGGSDEGLDKLVLWVEMKKQIEILREGMETKI